MASVMTRCVALLFKYICDNYSVILGKLNPVAVSQVFFIRL